MAAAVAVSSTAPSGIELRAGRVGLRLTQRELAHRFNEAFPDSPALSGPIVRWLEIGIVAPGPLLAARPHQFPEDLAGGAP